ncbi:hypothetical protein [Croceicoccus pelagius]|uniref:Uncharacterized protein n=1 Tax=Croceicoccus pelagius TaxID=1703341 RepID=A0A916YHS9_9SPHN|nr:hypothetical protein [Croceicoccus pelagius]GGD45355.1 hypothetical protein GCM10010989_19360 [Croceicoccus pelagius]
MNIRNAVIGSALAVLALSGCARETDLRPVEGASLPPTPYGADTQPDADDLLERPAQAAPERSVELRTRSEEREQDPFDLPPEG